jgi:hypothetical protein
MLQKVSPHETFQMTGDYLKVCGNVGKKKYVTLAPDAQIIPSGSRSRKSRIGIIPLRDARGQFVIAGKDYQIADAPAPPPKPGQSAFDLRKSLSSLLLVDDDEDNVTHLPKTKDDAVLFPVFSRLQAEDKSKRLSLDLSNARVNQSALVQKMMAPTNVVIAKKFNSTSSLYVKDTINLPNIDDLTKW